MFYQYLLLSTPVMMGIVLTIYVKKMLRDEEKKRASNIEKDINASFGLSPKEENSFMSGCKKLR